MVDECDVQNAIQNQVLLLRYRRIADAGLNSMSAQIDDVEWAGARHIRLVQCFSHGCRLHSNGEERTFYRGESGAGMRLMRKVRPPRRSRVG